MWEYISVLVRPDPVEGDPSRPKIELLDRHNRNFDRTDAGLYALLNELGQEGWELVGMVPVAAIQSVWTDTDDAPTGSVNAVEYVLKRPR